jgi:hypothetical protein
MRSAILLLAVLIAGCAQSDKRKKDAAPVVRENPPLSERIRIFKRERDQEKAEETTAETSVDGVVVR